LKLRITIDGTAYEVEVEVLVDDEGPETAAHVPHHAATIAPGGAHTPSHSAWDSDGKIARSPIMGMVIKVSVEPGQQVQAGEVLIVLEAMKMETSIAAPQAGIVKSILVSQGNSVKQNQILAELE
jgi:biotin carboxyl carrier protein